MKKILLIFLTFILVLFSVSFLKKKSEEKALFQKQEQLIQERRLYTWTSPDGQHRNQIDCILCSQRWRSSIQSTKTRLGAHCGPFLNPA